VPVQAFNWIAFPFRTSQTPNLQFCWISQQPAKNNATNQRIGQLRTCYVATCWGVQSEHLNLAAYFPDPATLSFT